MGECGLSVNGYLERLSSRLVLTASEKASIETSLATLSSRLNYYFNKDEMKRHFQFGSSTRGTILPRKVDSGSDIDYMIIFKNPNGFKPETLLRYLKNFMHKYYSTSDIYKDSPTMVLKLNHIKFELTPALEDWIGNLSIPSTNPSKTLSEWIHTEPVSFNKKLTDANVRSQSKLKPVIRLMKYWNKSILGGYYSSFKLEEWIVDRYAYSGKDSIKLYVYEIIEALIPDYNSSQAFKRNLEKSKQVIANCKKYESMGQYTLAETEIKKLFSEF